MLNYFRWTCASQLSKLRHLTNKCHQMPLTNLIDGPFLFLKRDTMEHLLVLFTSTDRRAAFQASFQQTKQTLIAKEALKRPAPKFYQAIPIRKTRAGLQFSCASATLAQNQPTGNAGANATVDPFPPQVKEVWVCNSDGFVGQVCVLSLTSEPTVTSCNGVCNARILCIAAVPAYR